MLDEAAAAVVVFDDLVVVDSVEVMECFVEVVLVELMVEALFAG